MSSRDEKTEAGGESPIENLALRSGLSIILLKDESPRALVKANNNSICEILYDSGEFSARCAKFCGAAFRDAVRAGETTFINCHAGLNYAAVPLETVEKQTLVAIVGRTFAKSEEYKNAADRAVSGDWQTFPTEDLFKNVLLGNSKREIDKTIGRLKQIVSKEPEFFTNMIAAAAQVSAGTDVSGFAENPPPEIAESGELSKMIENFHRNSAAEIGVIENNIRENQAEAEEFAAWRAVFGSLLELKYKNAYPAVMNFLASRYALNNLAWLENTEGRLKSILAIGEFSEQPIEIGIAAGDARLLEAVRGETSLELRERGADNPNHEGKTISLFPVSVGEEILGGLIVGGNSLNSEIKTRIVRFIESIAPELEILRLREKIERQSRTTKAIQKLNENLKNIDGDEFWNAAAQISAELMRAERSSLLILNEGNEELTVKAAVGSRADAIKREDSQAIGRRVAHGVLKNGKPLIVSSLSERGIEPAPSEWRYKTDSFISCPITIGGRKIGVLNITDAIDGENYDESDLELLNTLSPQLAVALDRTSLKRQTAELRQISITDPLTGLLNRRYLEERLTEEIARTERHGHQLSFMMIDVDEFKSYNDQFTHLEGDKALQIVGQCLKATLRGADVAARFGGEEFSILLPQTNVNEAFVIAERLRRKVAATVFPNRQVTISIGIATCAAEACSAKELMSAADKALYRAKGEGRNNVQIFREFTSAGNSPIG